MNIYYKPQNSWKKVFSWNVVIKKDDLRKKNEINDDDII
jgi:hypothetical protein